MRLSGPSVPAYGSRALFLHYVSYRNIKCPVQPVLIRAIKWNLFITTQITHTQSTRWEYLIKFSYFSTKKLWVLLSTLFWLTKVPYLEIRISFLPGVLREIQTIISFSTYRTVHRTLIHNWEQPQFWQNEVTIFNRKQNWPSLKTSIKSTALAMQNITTNTFLFFPMKILWVLTRNAVPSNF